MWRRFRRKSFAPRRPALFPEQYALAIFVAAFIAGGIALVVVALR
jgi:hypothetical protein